ncbi:peptide ABC transporter substrate-binding protein [Leptotrichia sp. OH3620_COT-345]|uniref:peptide ABC transporter substrate-binding protein n=1 Tax=Leptotrichia sp. OH3620_COT-345 TaxID=2491048 RepID=UPI000F653D8B|nr:peptide ABC transporter substrate-binding protein [Leptotrichia sp. OH3620_COT-345]RRD40628.1 peptide ABC transporter substrate-binding protein [Leptotrichia sp. OH3620_COT-345]
MRKILLTLAVVIFIMACGGNLKKSNTISLNLRTEPSSIDPQITTDVAGGTVDDLIMEGLLRKDKDGKSVAGLAEKWESSSDGLVWTFHLREGLKWSNGDPITVKDFRDGWIRALDPVTAASNANLLFPIKNGEAFNAGKVKAEEVGIKIIDDRTLEVTLEAPTPYFDDLITFKAYMPLNEKYFKEVGEKYFTSAETTISSGPYLLKEWKNDSHFTFEKNPDYWDASNIKADSITLKLIDTTAASNAFKNGEVDVTSVTLEQSSEYKGKPELVQANDGGVWYILLNTKVKPINNIKIRNALLMGIDRKELVEKALSNSEKYIKSFVPGGIGIKGLQKDFSEEVPTSIPEFNLDKAKELLSEGLKEEGLTKFPELELIFAEGVNTKIMAEYIQESLRKNLGIEIKLSIVTGKERIQRSKQRDYQMALANWVGDFQDPITYLDLFDSKNANNRGDFTNSRYDELVKTVKSTADPQTRVTAMLEMEKIISEEAPVIVLFQRQKRYLVNPKVKGLGFMAIGGEFFLRELYMGN